MLPDLINYTILADSIIVNTFAAAGKPMPNAETLFSHVLNAQHIWVERIAGKTPAYTVFDLHPANRFKEIHLKNSEGLLSVCHNRDLSEQLIYKNSQGEEFFNVLRDILFHIVNHSTYHRAQIAIEFKLNGIKPPVTDYIMLKREGRF